MKALPIAVLLFVITVTTASAQTTVLYRTDLVNGQATHTYAVLTPKVELWAFNPGTAYADIEVGGLRQVSSPKGAFLMAGGYAVLWPNQSKVFLLPYLLGKASAGSVRLAGVLGYYVPLNGGPKILFSDEASAMVPLNRRVQLGLATSFWSQDGVTTYGVGPKVSANIGGGITLSLRFLRGNAPDSFRILETKTF